MEGLKLLATASVERSEQTERLREAFHGGTRDCKGWEDFVFWWAKHAECAYFFFFFFCEYVKFGAISWKIDILSVSA